MVLFPTNATNQKSILITKGGGVEKEPKIYIFYNTIFLSQEICSFTFFPFYYEAHLMGKCYENSPRNVFSSFQSQP